MFSGAKFKLGMGDGSPVTASLNAKSLRKAVTTLKDCGDYAVILQGKLAPRGNTIEEAGLAVQAKAPKAAA